MRTSILGVAFALGVTACGSSSPSSGGNTSTGLPPSASDNNTVGSPGMAIGNGGSSSGGASSGTSSDFGGGSGGSSGSGSGSSGTGADSIGMTAGPSATSGGGKATSTSGGGGSSSGGIVATAPDGGEDASPPAPPLMSGVLTAGVWDDSLNYNFFTNYLALHPGLPGDPGFTTADYSASHTKYSQRAANTVIDAALVIDTTGSMGDEIAYLKAEFANIAGAISTKFPNSNQRWALIVYRDTPDHDPGDAYVTKTFDFTSDMQAFSMTVDAQSAANGGDYPESPELGLDQLEKLTWRTDPTVAKVAFWVADAPQHDDRGPQMNMAISAARDAGIHVYPVSASGTDTLLEYTMRTTAEITGGRYLFLTDDSGVGDPHKVPEIPCYYVTLLEKALVRVAGMELSGSYMGPDMADVIRVSGNASSDGTCSDFDGGVVKIF